MGYAYIGFPSGKESARQYRRLRRRGLIPGLGRTPGGENGNPPQYSCLGNPMDREEPGRLQSLESQIVGHALETEPTHTHTCIHRSALH